MTVATSPDLAGRVAALTELLERLPELTEPGNSPDGIAGSGDRLTLMPHDPHCAFIGTMKVVLGGVAPKQRECNCWRRCILELERLLYELQFWSWTSWKHVRMRYLQCDFVTVDAQYRGGKWRVMDTQTRRWRGLECEQVLAMSGGWTLAMADHRLQKADSWQDARVKLARWSPSVQSQHVRAGVEWMAENWAPGFEPYLPVVKAAA